MAATPTAADDCLTAVLRILEEGRRPDKERLIRRISFLCEAYAEDYGGAVLSSRSAAACVEFLEAEPTVPYPDLTATPSGDLFAEWRGLERRTLSIEFLDSGEVRFLLMWPNSRHPSLLDRISGRTTADALGRTLMPLVHLTGMAA